MTRFVIAVVCALILVAPVGVPPTQSADSKAAFVEELVAAINSKSPDRRKALLHPKARVCATEASDSLQEEMFGRQAHRGIPTNYKWTVTPVPSSQPPLFADKFDYPIRPTHRLEIDYATGPTSSTSIVLQLVYDANQWREVTACPKPGTIEAAREAKKLRAKQAERVRALVAEVPPTLKNEMLKLIKEGRRVGAITRYATASGEDLATAKSVVEHLEAQAP
jgi:hypothetical protein